ncbi:MAG: glycosyltransferase family 2 protein [Thermoanaerobaculales bacterium]|nr:glycosyltransferase family 2 protein [Thermoanaerobaculales bacterium]
MRSHIPVSAVLITRDAEAHLDRVLAPLAACREIVILDSGSTDRTREIAAAHGARWYEHPFDGYGPQKRRAVALAGSEWIVAVDADEVLDGEAAAELGRIDWSATDPRTSWRVRRRTFVGRREIVHGHWKTDRPVRVFNRRVTGFTAARVHESVPPTSLVRDLPGCVLHYSYADLADVIRLDYHRLKVLRYRAEGRRACAALLAARALWAGFHSYVLRAGFREGGAGVVIALAAAVNATMGLAMASEPAPPGPRVVPDDLPAVGRDSLPKTA